MRKMNSPFVKTGIEGLDEIIEGFPRGGLIVVSGAPGTGKTVFAASFIYNGIVRYGEPGVYGSMIEDERRFYEYMLRFGMDFEKLRDRGLFRYVALPTLLEPGIPSIANALLEAVEEIGARRLVIDSYTAISQMFKSEGEARVFLHTVLSKIVRELNCTTIIIKEMKTGDMGQGYSHEDFIAEGVIHLRTHRLEDKLARELTIVKLRGSELRNPDVCFTLYRGFKVLPPVRIDGNIAYRRIEYPPDPPGGYTTGIPDLDQEIGGYPDGSTILFEIDAKLTYREYSIITAPVVASYILRGRPCIIVPSGGVTVKDLVKLGKLYGVDEKYFQRYMRIVVESNVWEERLSNVIRIKPDEEVGRRLSEVVESLIKEFGKPPIRVYGVDRIVRLYGEKAIDLLHTAQDRIRRRGGLALWLLKPVKPWLSEMLAPIADIHLKIMRRHGCILLYGIKPRTPLYAVRLSDSPIPKIIPIV
ncbi:MAG: hypothetical protein DRN59_02515 [Thaumarchaeota archaeon]|nr:MAG: hypothetical protein DRN59_02515 [Nitrososphaerota archaeon]